MAQVAVIGSGYVGLTQAVGLTHLGHTVVAADIDTDRVEMLNRGEPPIFEDRLPELLGGGLASKRLSFVVGAEKAVQNAEFVFLCVPTPQGDDGSANLSFLETAARQIAPQLLPGAIVINKSTVPVGTAARVQELLKHSSAPAKTYVCSNPEFLREGLAINDFLNPSRVVIGADDPAIAVKVADLYSNLNAPTLITDTASAEMIKYASNSFLATKISFINAVANLCEEVGADVREVAIGMGFDPRIGAEFLSPGPGYGGSCFPKDTAALLHIADKAGYDFHLLRGVRQTNEEQLQKMIEKISEAAGRIERATVAMWGLTFKAGTDDLRDSPAVAIANELVSRGANVRAYDPAAKDFTKVPGVDIVIDAPTACKDADVLVIATEWDEFRWIDLPAIREAMAKPNIVDMRNLLDPDAVRKAGFTYSGVGR